MYLTVINIIHELCRPVFAPAPNFSIHPISGTCHNSWFDSLNRVSVPAVFERMSNSETSWMFIFFSTTGIIMTVFSENDEVADFN